MKRRKEVELQLTVLQAEKKSAMAAASKLVDGNEERATQLERELTALRTEVQALGKNHHSSTGQGALAMLYNPDLLSLDDLLMKKNSALLQPVEEEKKRRLEVEKQLLALQAQQKATLAATTTQSDIQTKDESERVKAREIERERQQKQHKVG
jgi:hypothetical protein